MLQKKYALTLEAAKGIIAAAEVEAVTHHWPVVIAVVDAGGVLLCLQRMDDAQSGSVEVAIEKARSAVRFKRPTQAFEEGVANGRLQYLGLPGAVPIEGGLPLYFKGDLVGAIGTSGVRAVEDAQISRAGVAELAAMEQRN